MVCTLLDEETEDKTLNEDLKTPEELDKKKLNYVKVGQLLTELGYLPLNLAPDSVERELLFDFWNLLKGEEQGGVSVINIKVMLFAIQGIVLEEMVSKDREGTLMATLDRQSF